VSALAGIADVHRENGSPVSAITMDYSGRSFRLHTLHRNRASKASSALRGPVLPVVLVISAWLNALGASRTSNAIRRRCN